MSEHEEKHVVAVFIPSGLFGIKNVYICASNTEIFRKLLSILAIALFPLFSSAQQAEIPSAFEINTLKKQVAQIEISQQIAGSELHAYSRNFYMGMAAQLPGATLLGAGLSMGANNTPGDSKMPHNLD